MKSGSMANRRAQFIADRRTSANTRHLSDEEMNIVKKLILAVAVLAGIHVCGNSRTLTLAQDKPTPSTGMVVRSAR